MTILIEMEGVSSVTKKIGVGVFLMHHC
jgi:hypothetical protein